MTTTDAEPTAKEGSNHKESHPGKINPLTEATCAGCQIFWRNGFYPYAAGTVSNLPADFPTVEVDLDTGGGPYQSVMPSSGNFVVSLMQPPALRPNVGSLYLVKTTSEGDTIRRLVSNDVEVIG
jgi:hypothetical protein